MPRWRRRRPGLLVLLPLLCACRPAAPPAPDASQAAAPVDGLHAGINEPHGDHTPHQGGLVLMNGDVHYEVVMRPSGRYEVWFTDAVRTELPASVATHVRVIVRRPGGAAETVRLAIDEAGESWEGQGQPVAAGDVMVTVAYEIKGTPHEVEMPFVAAGQ